MTNRIEYLDGHRGVAILLVVLFHAYARWPELVPYGDAYAGIPVFRYGWLGVELFFLVSGFAILMTLERCAGAREFLWRRWLRLFPAMLFCTLLVFATAGYFSERPDGAPSAASVVPGLTFMEPSWWQSVLGLPVKPLEGGFWSLYVEVKFYLFAALVYFSAGRNWLIGALAVAFLSGTACKLADAQLGGATFAALNNLCRNLSFEYFGWFAAGAAFYVYTRTASYRWLLGATVLALLSGAFLRAFDWPTLAAASLISLFFAASLVSVPLQRLLANRFLQFFAFVSYPLYLLQENLMIATIVKLGHANVQVPLYLYPLLPIGVLAGAAYFVARCVEPAVKKVLAGVTVKRPLHRSA